ncbi:MAG: hypothetical protein ABIP75_15700 [Pyrinomonadaceae bacterium]
MNTQQSIEVFSGHSPQGKVELLAQFSHELTILAREGYAPGTEELNDPRRLRVLNELQHRITGFLLALLTNDLQRFSDEVLVRMILESGDNDRLNTEIQAIFNTLVERSVVPS